MKTTINAPAHSKINYTALVIALIGAAIAFDVVPEAAREPLIEVTLILGPTLIAVFRTWFTEPK